MASHSKPVTFLALPREIRDEIYASALTIEEPIELAAFPEKNIWQVHRIQNIAQSGQLRTFLSLRRTNKSVGAETSEAFYKTKVFILEANLRSYLPNNLTCALSPVSLSSILHIDITMPIPLLPGRVAHGQEQHPRTATIRQASSGVTVTALQWCTDRAFHHTKQAEPRLLKIINERLEKAGRNMGLSTIRMVLEYIDSGCVC